MTYADSIWAKAIEAHADRLQARVDSLQAKLNGLQDKTDLLYNVIEPANSSISNQLTTISVILGVVGLIITVFGIWLSIRISKKKKEIDEIANTVEKEKESVIKMAKKTEKLDQHIRKNLSDLYKDLRNEETNTLLDRLVLEPTDVSNLNGVLMSREINEEGYNKLKKAFLKLKEDQDGQEINPLGHDYFGEFVVLFFQHFFYQAIMDDDISSEFESRYDMIFSRANKRDMIKSTTDLCKALSDRNATFEKEGILVSYLKSLNLSLYNNLPELKNIFKQNITPQSLLQSAINRCTADQVYLELFGVTSPDSGMTTPQQNVES